MPQHRNNVTESEKEKVMNANGGGECGERTHGENAKQRNEGMK